MCSSNMLSLLIRAASSAGGLESPATDGQETGGTNRLVQVDIGG
jgi:hypothetical protein